MAFYGSWYPPLPWLTIARSLLWSKVFFDASFHWLTMTFTLIFYGRTWLMRVLFQNLCVKVMRVLSQSLVTQNRLDQSKERAMVNQGTPPPQNRTERIWIWLLCCIAKIWPKSSSFRGCRSTRPRSTRLRSTLPRSTRLRSTRPQSSRLWSTRLRSTRPHQILQIFKTKFHKCHTTLGLTLGLLSCYGSQN